jgi:hypothetical protein
MNKWKQNIAIAEASGWERGPAKSSICGPSFLMAGQHWHKKSEKDCWIDCCPNFVDSLEKMHDAVQTLSAEDYDLFKSYLRSITGALSDSARVVIEATSSQRAEAFLKTLGLWIEKDPDDEKS